MIKSIVCLLFTMMVSLLNSQTRIESVNTTKTDQWKTKNNVSIKKFSDKYDVEINSNNRLQTIEGFGTCFNEGGWTSLNLLNASDREKIFKELFAKNTGADFTICRMPIGANDFSRDWYSYNETDGDFEMKNFSIANDKETLIPFIKNAQKYNPDLKLWASPWSPPSWMKYNKHYALKSLQKGITNIKSDEWGIDFIGLDNGLKPDQEGKEGTNMFIQEDKYFKAYALYFSKFIQTYKKEKINISMVMPQNEFNSAQPFPSCTWTANGLAKFISYLGPQMNALNVKIFFGTMERPNEKLVDTILTSELSSKYVSGVGFQWAGKEAIPGIHKKYPDLTLYQSEQECGNGKNDWKYAKYTWDLMKHYFNNGASAYMYWNTSLRQNAISRWGWKQNSLISVDAETKTYRYNYDYYVLKHLSHYVKHNAKLVATNGSFKNLLVFVNPDKSIVIVLQNDDEKEKTVNIKVENKIIGVLLEPDSFNTLLIKQN
ncbi:MAG: beta-glycosidase [Bacteroidota bacterium]|nr:beta-glycosidase [Bacteroidota bacterium]